MGKLNDFPLRDFVSKGFDTLIETGSGTGTGIDAALAAGFKRVFSCEFVREQAIRLRVRYRDEPRLVLSHQESPAFLDYLFTSLVSERDRCVIWSDAHYPFAEVCGLPYDYEKDLRKRLPLEDELEVLLKHKRRHDILLLDDYRIYRKLPMQGGDLEALGLGHIARYDAPDFLKPWRETHAVFEEHRDTGYIVMMPH